MKQLFNDKWEFTKFPLDTPMEAFFETDSFKPVDLPHDWMIYNVKNLYEEAVTCYRKTFLAPEHTNQKVILRFEGVYMNTTIYLNQKQIFEWKYGYSTFDVDLTDLLVDGENEILVHGVYQLPNSRWYPGSGIYRNVWLITKPLTYFPLDGSYISTKKKGEDFTVFADIEYTSNGEGNAIISHTVTDASGHEVATNEQTVVLSTDITVNSQQFVVKKPALWDIESPYIYKLTTTLTVDGVLMDSVTQNLGFRTFHIDPNKGFFLNDRHIKIHGTCLHHDLGSLGAAFNETALRRQMVKLKEMGVNSVRTAHNMPAVEVMNVADEMGILIYSESFDMWERTKTDYDYGNFFADWWKKDLTSWVRRDRNHPCLIVWGIGNEIYDTHFDRGLELTKILRDAVIELDPRRNGLIGMGSNYIAWENAQRCGAELDIVGYNYQEHLYDEHHEKFPDWCIFGSETSSTVQSRGIYHFPASNRLLTYDDLQCSSIENCTSNWGARTSMDAIIPDRDHEFCFGQYIWSGWDYIGEPTPYFTKNSYFGQIDTAGFEKDTFYIYQSEWTDYKKAPMIHLAPYWDFNEGQLIDIRVHTNAPKMELFFNDKSLGVQEIDHKHGTELSGKWQLPYTKGELKAVAYDENDQIVATDIQRSFTDPVEIEAIPSRTQCKANGTDLIFISIATLGENKTFVANGRSRMTVNVTGAGRLVGLDNGDSTDYDEYKGTSRKLFSGRLLAIVAPTDEVGEINVTISSPSLPDHKLTLTSVACEEIPGLSCTMRNTQSEPNNEIPVRKIELLNHGTNQLNEDEPTTTITATLLPANTTYTDVVFKALTLDGIESNCVSIEQDGLTAKVTGLGDGEFRLCCQASNGLDHPEVLSELEFTITGLGQATHDPYSTVSAITYTKSNFDLKLSFLGGVYITSNERTYLQFDHIDFGDYGSDEIHLPIFSFNDKVPVEVWEGIPSEGGTKVLEAEYTAKSWYNHYQENVFKLSKRLKGTITLTIVVVPEIKMSLQGFSFTRYEKAFSTLYACENNRITGDMFTLDGDYITNIGNNVTLEYERMDFGDNGMSEITICGRSHIEMNTIHMHVINETEDITQILEVPFSEDYIEKTFPLQNVKGRCKVNFIFLPGSKFDLHWFKFK